MPAVIAGKARAHGDRPVPWRPAGARRRPLAPVGAPLAPVGAARSAQATSGERPDPWRLAGAPLASVGASRPSHAAPGRTGTARSRGAPLAPVGASRQRAAIAKYGMDCHARAWHRGTRGALLKGKTK